MLLMRARFLTERFAMHDVVYALARPIALQKKNGSRVTVAGTVLPPSSSIRNGWLLNCTHMTLRNIELSEFLPLEYPKLKFLYLRPKSLVRISHEFFACMSNLEVLHFVNIDLLSVSFDNNFINLGTLSFQNCILKEIDVGDLKNLQILLSFRNCKMDLILEKFFHLTQLRIIELNYCDGRFDLRWFISSFKVLEGLYICSHYFPWKNKKSSDENTADSGGDENTADSGYVLKYLTSLLIDVPNAKALISLLSPRLKRYNIVIAGRWSNMQWDSGIRNISRFLQVKCETEVERIISKLKGIKQLVVDEAPSMASNLIVDQPDLEDLRFHNNSDLFFIFQKVSQNYLSTLVLWNLENLETICNGTIGMECFPQLRTLKVGKCQKLTYIFLLTSSKDFQQLEEIEVSKCENMEVIFSTSTEAHEIKLNKLKILKLDTLPKLKSLSSSLKSSYVDIPAFLFHGKVMVANLQQLEVDGINIDMIWNNQAQKIKVFDLDITDDLEGRKDSILSIRKCEINSGEILPTQSTQSKELYTRKISSVKLENMYISSCENLKYLFGKEIVEEKEAQNATMEFVFPRLTNLGLYKLPQLRAFYPDGHTVEMAVLERVDLNISWTPETEEDHRMQQLFSVGKAFPHSEILTITANDLMMMWEGQDPGPLFQNFTTLYIDHDDYYDDEVYSGDELGLHLCCACDDDVECMREDMFKLEFILQYFETIHVRCVESFVSLVPSSSSLQNLTTLVVYHCSNLEDIGAFSIFKNLVNLIHLEIEDCPHIVEVIRNDEDLSGKKIVFDHMKRLILIMLDSLTSFCSLNLFLEFPCLEELKVIDRSNMKIFCCGDITTPNLHKLTWDRWDAIQLSAEVDLNEVIQQLQGKDEEERNLEIASMSQEEEDC